MREISWMAAMISVINNYSSAYINCRDEHVQVRLRWFDANVYYTGCDNRITLGWEAVG